MVLEPYIIIVPTGEFAEALSTYVLLQNIFAVVGAVAHNGTSLNVLIPEIV